MQKLIDRFLKYVSFDTQSDSENGKHPSSAKQFDLAGCLLEELQALKIEDVILTTKCYVYARIPATPGLEHLPPLGFIAHLDTSDAASGKNIKPQIIDQWDGKPILLGQSGLILEPEQHLQNQTLITTDGTTLLGADDKAGIAAIMTAVEKIITENLPHRALRIAFTPDEEIGEGTAYFDTKYFDAAYAYTVDGGAANVVEGENFNAAQAKVTVKGVAAHPGYAYNVMQNALSIAMEFHRELPADEVPEKTRNRQGFFHLTDLNGTASSAEMSYIIRDFDRENFLRRKEIMQKAAQVINDRYKMDTIQLDLRDQYFNMAEVIARHPALINKAFEAIRSQGLTPQASIIRGGTDGAQLSNRGLPCPNLGDGAYNIHSEKEYVSVDEMRSVSRMIVQLMTADDF